MNVDLLMLEIKRHGLGFFHQTSVLRCETSKTIPNLSVRRWCDQQSGLNGLGDVGALPPVVE